MARTGSDTRGTPSSRRLSTASRVSMSLSRGFRSTMPRAAGRAPARRRRPAARRARRRPARRRARSPRRSAAPRTLPGSAGPPAARRRAGPAPRRREPDPQPGDRARRSLPASHGRQVRLFDRPRGVHWTLHGFGVRPPQPAGAVQAVEIGTGVLDTDGHAPTRPPTATWSSSAPTATSATAPATQEQSRPTRTPYEPPPRPTCVQGYAATVSFALARRLSGTSKRAPYFCAYSSAFATKPATPPS